MFDSSMSLLNTGRQGRPSDSGKFQRLQFQLWLYLGALNLQVPGGTASRVLASHVWIPFVNTQAWWHMLAFSARLATQSSLLDKVTGQVKKRTCLKQDCGRCLRNDIWSCPLTSTCTHKHECTPLSIHMYQERKGRIRQPICKNIEWGKGVSLANNHSPCRKCLGGRLLDLELVKA